MRRRALLALVPLAACAEMRTPPPPAPAAELSGGIVPEPGFAIARLAALDFDNQGLGLAGRPAEAALAVARLEWLALAQRPAGPFATWPTGMRFMTARALEEARAAMAIRAEADGPAVIAALVEAARALRRGGEPSLPPALFRDARPTARERLDDPGPLPNAQLATAALWEEAQRR